MPHLECGPSEYSFSTPKNESATPSSIDKMPPYASLPEIKLTSTHVLQNREQQTGIQLSHTRGSQKYDEQMMAMEYIDNEAKIDDTSACTISSPPFVISPDLKKSPISGSQPVTKRKLNYSGNYEKKNKSSDNDCMKNVKQSMSNAKDCKQNGTVKKHKQSERVQVTLHQCQDFYVKK
jgi:hypothetical protein